MRYYLLALAISAAVSFVMSVIAWRFGLKYKIYPKIRERDVHKTPTPRLGGVAMWAGVVVALLSAWFVFPSSPTSTTSGSCSPTRVRLWRSWAPRPSS
nr:hypothetical protein GCM10025699_49510 [Microbacterium flavescens]